MISKCIILLALVAVGASASAIKGYQQREELAPAKGGRLLAPIEQQRLIEQTQRREEAKGVAKQEELREEFQQKELQQLKQEPEQLPEQKVTQEEWQTQQKEEQQKLEELPKGGRYEAKPQLHREELAKGQFKQEKIEQFKQEEQRELKPEQKLETIEQQVEIKQEEQRRFEEQPALIQPILPLTVIEETRAAAGTKGGQREYGAAPLGEAEPYAFSYNVDGSSRSESGDTKGTVRGQYTLQGADGSSRVVDYVADHNGFRASVNTNEFGTEAKSPAGVALKSSQPLAEDITLRLEGKTREDLLPPAAPIAVAVKGATPQFAAPAAPLAVAKGQPAFAWQTPAKGQRLEEFKGQRSDEFKGQRLEELKQEQEPIRSAELKSPKAAGQQQEFTKQLPAQARASFESATAHRPVYRAPVQPVLVHQHVRPQPPTVLVRDPRVRPVVAPARVHRYPVSPVASRRYPENPRVSFYGPASGAINYDEEIPSEF